MYCKVINSRQIRKEIAVNSLQIYDVRFINVGLLKLQSEFAGSNQISCFTGNE